MCMLAKSLLCVWSLFPATHACECVHSSHIHAFVPLATQMSSEDEESEEEELDPEAEKKAVMEKLEAEFEEVIKRWLVHRLNSRFKVQGFTQRPSNRRLNINEASTASISIGKRDSVPSK